MSENYYHCLIETDYYEIVLMRNINQQQMVQNLHGCRATHSI